MKIFLFLCLLCPSFVFAVEMQEKWQGNVIFRENLPYAVRQKLKIIAQGAPYPLRQDNTVFHNLPPKLPKETSGFYRLFVIENSSYCLIQAGNHFYYSPDSLNTFYKINHAH